MPERAPAPGVMVTTCALVRVTSAKVRLAVTAASNPVASTPPESIPVISAVVMALSAPTVASQWSVVSVMISVSPPVMISASAALSASVPVSAAAAGAAAVVT